MNENRKRVRRATSIARSCFRAEGPLAAAIMVEPSSWPTSDVPLEQRVQSCLEGQGRGIFHGVNVRAHADTVTLTGVVVSFYAKQLAQELTRRVPGVVRVVNLIDVGDSFAPDV